MVSASYCLKISSMRPHLQMTQVTAGFKSCVSSGQGHYACNLSATVGGSTVEKSMGCRALLFSSDAEAAAVLRKGLVEIDLAVDHCSDPATALEKLAATAYSAVVIDTPEAPVRNGVLRQLRCTPLNKNTMVIATVIGQGNGPHVFGMGANFVLYRPLDEDRVRASMRAANRLIPREKRRSFRAPVNAAADISCPAIESASATLLDLSEEGLSLQCELGLPQQSKIYFRFTLPGQIKAIQLSGETMWQDAAGRVGIRFVDVPQSAKRLMKEWLDLRLSVVQSKVKVEVPAGQPGPLATSPSDRRTESRHSCHLGAEVYRAGRDIPHRCILTDISVGGCYVEMPSPFSVGTSVEVVVRTNTFKFVSAGSVQTVNRAFGMGVAFATQTPEQRVLLHKLIKIAFEGREAEADAILKF